jgi:structural maintenance of chromosome 1
MACFQHVSHELQIIYRDLTKSSKHPLGGNAYLSLDDTEVRPVLPFPSDFPT